LFHGNSQEDTPVRFRSFAALIAVLVITVPVMAQEQRASLEGFVKANTGAVLPGAVINAKSETGATLTTTSDKTGTFRFPAVSPGTYVVSATLTGFRRAEVKDVRVGLGQVRQVEFTLALATLAETVQVTSESPLVDVRQSTRQTNIRAEQVALLPKGRDFLTLVTQAPGANLEPKSGGEDGRTSPNVGRLYDYPLMMFQMAASPRSAAADRSAAPVQGAVHLPAAEGDELRAQWRNAPSPRLKRPAFR